MTRNLHALKERNTTAQGAALGNVDRRVVSPERAEFTLQRYGRSALTGLPPLFESLTQGFALAITARPFRPRSKFDQSESTRIQRGRGQALEVAADVGAVAVFEIDPLRQQDKNGLAGGVDPDLRAE